MWQQESTSDGSEFSTQAYIRNCNLARQRNELASGQAMYIGFVNGAGREATEKLRCTNKSAIRLVDHGAIFFAPFRSMRDPQLDPLPSSLARCPGPRYA